jgi:hypothetical protein
MFGDYEMKYIVTNTYHYTTTVEVEAESKREALETALTLDGDRNHDDVLYESTVDEADE